jgi:glycosyltransferase involved in cell wall biosynthesis
MHGPIFSIVTVALNAGARLETTAASLSRQSFGDWEHIVKDGGSTDMSLASLPKDDRRRIIVKPDSGIFDAMNQALAECRGRYVLFLNAGDVFCSDDVLAAVADSISTSAAPIVLTYVFYKDSQSLRPYPQTLGRSYLYRQIPCQQALYVALDAYRRYGGFRLDFPCLADPELLLRLVLGHRLPVAICPRAGVVFEGGGFSSTESFRRRASVERKRLQKMYFSFGERLRWTLRRALVLHPLRERLNRRFPRGPVARLNHWITYYLNRKS